MRFFDSQRREARNRSLWRAAYLAAIAVTLAGIGGVAAFLCHLAEAPATALPTAFWIGSGAGALLVLVSTLRYPLGRQRAAQTALALGARPLEAERDSERRRLLNVCAEMAISARIPAPSLFLLEDEIGINALALGRRPDDSVIVVSAGCFLHLDRDALQALLAWCIGRIRDGECGFDSELLSLHHGLLAPYRCCLAPVRWMLDRLHGIPVGYTRTGAPVDARPLALLFGAPALLAAAVSALGFVFASVLQAAALRRGMLKSDAAVLELTRQQAPLQRLLAAVQPGYRRSRLRARGLEALGHFSFAPIAWLPPLFIESHPGTQQRLARLGAEPPAPTSARAALAPAPTPLREGATPTALRGEAPIAHNILFPQGNGQRLRYRDAPAPPDPALLARCADADGAIALLDSLFTPASASRHGEASSSLTPSGQGDPAAADAQLANASARQRLALIDAASPTLAALPREQRDALLGGWQRHVRSTPESLLLWGQWQCLIAGLPGERAADPEPCTVEQRAWEVRQLLGWMLVRNGAAGAIGLALLQRHEVALGLAPSPRLVLPDLPQFTGCLARLAGLDAAARATLLQALHELAQHDRRQRDDEWLLLRGLSAQWALPLP